MLEKFLYGIHITFHLADFYSFIWPYKKDKKEKHGLDFRLFEIPRYSGFIFFSRNVIYARFVFFFYVVGCLIFPLKIFGTNDFGG